MSQPSSTRFYFATLLAYGILTTGLVLFLSYRLYQAYSELAQVRSEVNPRAGSSVPSFTAVDMDGNRFTVGFGAGPITVLCFVSSDCEFCHKAAPLWNELEETSTLRLIGVAVDGVEAFRARTDWQLSFPLVEVTDPATRLEYGVSRVPLTLAVDRSGTVLFSFTGVPDTATLLRIRSLGERVPVSRE